MSAPPAECVSTLLFQRWRCWNHVKSYDFYQPLMCKKYQNTLQSNGRAVKFSVLNHRKTFRSKKDKRNNILDIRCDMQRSKRLRNRAFYAPEKALCVRSGSVWTWRDTHFTATRLVEPRPPCRHLKMSFGCVARLVSLFVVWVYVGRGRGVARSALTWQERLLSLGTSQMFEICPLSRALSLWRDRSPCLKISSDDI